MQLLGGVLLGLVAGKRGSKRLAAAFLATFTLCGIGIGLAPNAAILFGCVACFEVVRQFMRWLQTGYVSECVPAEQRTAAISVAVLLSGIGASGFMLLLRLLQSPDSPSFSPTLPFLIAGAFGLVGAVVLLCHRAGARPAAPLEAAPPVPSGSPRAARGA
jgi:MFS family permease